MINLPQNWAFFPSKNSQSPKNTIFGKVHRNIYIRIPMDKITLLIKRTHFKHYMAIIDPQKISFRFWSPCCSLRPHFIVFVDISTAKIVGTCHFWGTTMLDFQKYSFGTNFLLMYIPTQLFNLDRYSMIDFNEKWDFLLLKISKIHQNSSLKKFFPIAILWFCIEQNLDIAYFF